MAIICWGNLTKSADSTQKIDQAIEEYIAKHDENPNAHMGEDYALGSHRLQTELDHLHGSVQLVHLAMDSIISFGSFESMDGFNIQGNANAGVLGASLETQLIEDTRLACIFPKNLAEIFEFRIDKNTFFQTTIATYNSVDLAAFFGIGGMYADDQECGVGFAFFGEEVHACWFTSTGEHTHQIPNISSLDLHCYRVYIDSANNIVHFIIDGVQVYQRTTTDLATGVLIPFSWKVISNGESNKTLYICDWLFQQNR